MNHAFIEKQEQTKKEKTRRKGRQIKRKIAAILLAFLCVFSSSLFVLS
jgi:hypothetical protein